MTYTNDLFSAWQGNFLISGLSSQAIIRIEIDGDDASEVERFDMGARIRGVTQGPDGVLWVLEDDRGDSQGRMLKLTPSN
jgi:glucose/arabinose dehydrogenase